MSIHEDYPTHYGFPHKYLWEKIFRVLWVSDPWANLHEKLGNLAVLRKGLVKVDMSVKNSVSIPESFLTNYGGRHNFFWEKMLGAPRAWSMANTHEKSRNFGWFLQKSCKCEMDFKKMIWIYIKISQLITKVITIFLRKLFEYFGCQNQ